MWLMAVVFREVPLPSPKDPRLPRARARGRFRRPWLSKERFEELVSEAWDSLPEGFQRYIDNVGLIVEDLPSRRDLEELGIRSPFGLLGLYRGISLNRRGIHYQNVLPDMIVIYRLPILAICRTEDEVRAQVRKTVVHEVAHYFGMNERQVREAMAGWEEFPRRGRS